MQRIEVNMQTGEQKILDLTEEEVAQALAMKAAWDAQQEASRVQPTQDEIIASLMARISALEKVAP
jgi:hypothetical protein